MTDTDGVGAYPLRVMILHAPTGIGGAEGVIFNINRFIDPKRVQLFNCPFINFTRGRSTYLEELAERGITCDAVPLVRRVEYRYISATRDLIRRHAIQLIHSHGYRSDITALLASRGRIPVVSTIHGFTASSSRVRIYENLQRMVLRCMQMVMPVSEPIERQVLDLGIPPDRVHRLANIVDYKTLSQVQPSPIFSDYGADEALKMVFVGRLSHEKGLDILLEACVTLKREGIPFSLLVVGDGPLRMDYEDLVVTHNLVEKVRFLGFRRDATAITAAADVFVLPSRTEGIPLVVLEAMALAKPIVAARVGGVPQLIMSADTGLLFDREDVQALIQKLTWVHLHRREAARIGEQAKNFMTEHFSPTAWAEELISIYYRVAGYDRLQ